MIFNEVERGFIDQDGWEQLRGFGSYPLTEIQWG